MNNYKFRFINLRKFIGIHGRQHDGSWCYGNAPETWSIKNKKRFYNFMFHIGNPVLNFIFGYKKLK